MALPSAEIVTVLMGPGSRIWGYIRRELLDRGAFRTDQLPSTKHDLRVIAAPAPFDMTTIGFSRETLYVP